MITIKITIFILVMCVLNLVKECFSVYSAYRNEKKYEATTLRNVLTMASIAFIITIIVCGL